MLDMGMKVAREQAIDNLNYGWEVWALYQGKNGFLIERTYKGNLEEFQRVEKFLMDNGFKCLMYRV